MVNALYDVTMVQLLPALAREQIRILTWPDLGQWQTGLTAYFRDAVLPVLTPLAIDEERPFPLLSSLSLNLALLFDSAPAAR